MNKEKLLTSKMNSRITDIVILFISYLQFALFTGGSDTYHLLLSLAIYVTVLFGCLRWAKAHVFAKGPFAHKVLNLLLGNGLGLVVGTILVLSIDAVILGSALLQPDKTIFASIMTFFVLGTLSPMIELSFLNVIRH